MSLRVFVLGAGGQVGRALVATAPPSVEVVAHTSSTLDVRDADALRAAALEARPGLIVNCAAWTNVDDAESHPLEAMEVNGEAIEGLAQAAREAGARVIHLSTEYVFDGEGGAPYTADHPPGPLNAYGRSKLEGESRLRRSSSDSLIVRTSWVHSGHGECFVRTAVRSLREGRSMNVVDDQLGTPTRASNLACALWILAARPAVAGVLHFTDAGVASPYDVAECVLGVLLEEGRVDQEARVRPVPTERVPRPARRPRFGVLSKHSSWGEIGWTPPHWRVGVIASTRELLDASAP